MLENNPFFQPFDTPFDAIPFHQIQNEHFVPAIHAALDETRNEIAHLKQNPEAPTFENTIEAFEYTGKRLSIICAVFFNLNHAHTDEEKQKIAQEVLPLLTQYRNDIALDKELFGRIKTVYEQEKTNPSSLLPEQKKLLEKAYKSFARNGANLSPEKQEKLRSIDQELSKASLTFGENLLADARDFRLVIEDEQELAGLPDSVREAAAYTAKMMGQEGKWVFTLSYPSYQPFMAYSKQRHLRKEIFMAYSSKGFRGNQYDNRELVVKIASLRHQRANLLGYASHADFMLEERMANSVSIVNDFLNEFTTSALPAYQRDIALLKQYALEKDGITTLEKWDILYYVEALKKEHFSIDDEVLRPYFKLENVIEGVFGVAKRLFGLNFIERNDIPTYHPDMKVYEVKNEANKHTALLYLDLFPRPGHKKDGAWKSQFRGQYMENGKNIRPHVILVCNFTKPTEDKPSLLTHGEVTTLLHEFGHGLHLMLSECQYDSVSGTNVSVDFVELPSQLLENWGYEAEVLNTFAHHYQTQESIPLAYLQKIKQARTFFEGYFTMRQLSFGLLDMAWHSQNPESIQDIVSFERKAMAITQKGFPDIEGILVSTSFSHIFQGGYSAGYYSYKWAEVLEADAFQAFEENGIFDEKTAQSLRENILSKGGTENAMELYKRFRGHTPSPQALLKKAGLIV